MPGFYDEIQSEQDEDRYYQPFEIAFSHYSILLIKRNRWVYLLSSVFHIPW